MTPTAVLLTVLGISRCFSSLRESPEGGCRTRAFLPVLMFNYAGEPWKTQRAVRHVMETEYLNEPGGLSGNDDAGQMSAWYMFAAMGFYRCVPGTPYYILASPSFPSFTLEL